MAKCTPAKVPTQVMCGVIAGPLFVGAFTAIGAKRQGYDWQAYPVSSLATGRRGWLQSANFILAGLLYSYAGRGLGRCPRRRVGPRAVPVLVAAVGVGLIGSGVFVTDPVGGFPPATSGEDNPDDAGFATTALTREGKLHTLCAVPIFVGIPIAGLASAIVAVRNRDYRWACYSAGSSLVMAGSFVLFGKAFDEGSGLSGKGGIFQRLSVLSGLGWIAALCVRALSSSCRR